MHQPSHDRIPEIALEWHRSGGSALAMVVDTWGSAPRPAGSQLAVSHAGAFEGSVSGGCVEGAVVTEAVAAIGSGCPVMLEFGVADEDAFAVGLACGGRIRVLVDPVGGRKGIPEEVLADLVRMRAERRPAALLIHTCNWEHRLSDDTGDGCGQAVSERMRQDRSGMEGDWFVNIHNPPLRLIIVGGAHIAQPLVAMARQAGYDPFLVDPRQGFATRERFPDTRISHDWPDEAIAAESPDSRTAVVTLTHDPKIDDPAIVATLATDAFYLGCLGSKTTHRMRLDRLRLQGMEDVGTARIHAPVGLDIGARSPSEIAIAIMGEITRALRQAGAGA